MNGDGGTPELPLKQSSRVNLTTEQAITAARYIDKNTDAVRAMDDAALARSLSPVVGRDITRANAAHIRVSSGLPAYNEPSSAPIERRELLTLAREVKWLFERTGNPVSGDLAALAGVE